MRSLLLRKRLFVVVARRRRTFRRAASKRFRRTSREWTARILLVNTRETRTPERRRRRCLDLGKKILLKTQTRACAVIRRRGLREIYFWSRDSKKHLRFVTFAGDCSAGIYFYDFLCSERSEERIFVLQQCDFFFLRTEVATFLGRPHSASRMIEYALEVPFSSVLV